MGDVHYPLCRRSTPSGVETLAFVAHTSFLINKFAALPSHHVPWVTWVCLVLAMAVTKPRIRPLLAGPLPLLAASVLVGTDLASSRATSDAEEQTRLVAVHLLRVVAKTAIATAGRRGESTDDLVAAVIRAGAAAWITPAVLVEDSPGHGSTADRFPRLPRLPSGRRTAVPRPTERNCC